MSERADRQKTLMGTKPDFGLILKQHLLKELPSSLTVLLDNLQHLHIGLFFIWKNYYEVLKRLLAIRYTYVGKATQS